MPPMRFTRQEQAVLGALARRPGTLVSRAQLLESLDPDCEGAGERSVDFLVNRLRRKLRDDARKPRFIATRYGEGYVWLVKGRRVDQSFILVRVESVYGFTCLSNAEVGTAAVRALATELGERLHWRCVMPPSLGLTHPRLTMTAFTGDPKFQSHSTAPSVYDRPPAAFSHSLNPQQFIYSTPIQF